MLQSTSDNVIIANVHNVVISCCYRLLRYYFHVGTPPSRWRRLRRQVTTGHCSVSRVYSNTYCFVINNASTFNISDNARANRRITNKQTSRHAHTKSDVGDYLGSPAQNVSIPNFGWAARTAHTSLHLHNVTLVDQFV